MTNAAAIAEAIQTIAQRGTYISKNFKEYRRTMLCLFFRFLSRIQTNSLLNWTSDMDDMKMDNVKNSAFQQHL